MRYTVAMLLYNYIHIYLFTVQVCGLFLLFSIFILKDRYCIYIIQYS